MTEDFMRWVGLDEARWQFIQDKLRRLVETERTPARIMVALMNDTSVGFREQVLLAYWLGRQQGMSTIPAPVLGKHQILIQGLN